MKILEDLGMQYATSKSKRKSHFYIGECPMCKNSVKFCDKRILLCKHCSAKENGKKCMKHNDSYTRLYRIWKNIKQRCTNKKLNNFKNYGGRGILLDNEWKNNYEIFKEWALKNGYEDTLSIDRIDNDGNYEPDNCRWTDKSTQNSNKRKNCKFLNNYIGVYFDKRRDIYRSELRFKNKTIIIGYFKSEKQAAIARNDYISKNNMPHTLNIID